MPPVESRGALRVSEPNPGRYPDSASPKTLDCQSGTVVSKSRMLDLFAPESEENADVFDLKDTSFALDDPLTRRSSTIDLLTDSIRLPSFLQAWTPHEALRNWIATWVTCLKPDSLHLVDGSDSEYAALIGRMVAAGTLTPLNPKAYPGCYLARSDPGDVARVEDRTFICSRSRDDAGPTNNWMPPEEMKAKLEPMFKGCMRGRTMYAIPFSMGPIGSPLAHYGVQLTDSPYVVVNMHIMTRTGDPVINYIASNSPFVPCVHSVGMPLEPGQRDVSWPCNPTNKYIVHFPEERTIWSYGSGYGGNALLGKKCFALRIASVMARDQGWLAEHMLILGVTNPQGVKKYIAAAFPSACGKTNLAMLVSKLPGWKFECVGDDIAWMRVGPDGRLYAVNPEAGFFGVAPGTSNTTNYNAMRTIQHDTLYTNTALTPDGCPWWEGMTAQPPESCVDWTGQAWTPACGRKAAHPNSRFTTAAKHCPVIDPNWESPKGVPISAIIFGGRRATTQPLVVEAFNWDHGVFMGASICSEQTAAANGVVGQLRHDPFAMLPFCGYNMGDYFNHWSHVGKRMTDEKRPKFFYVNWFRKGAAGEWLWPGFGENARVISWIFQRCDGAADAVQSPLGMMPSQGALVLNGLDVKPEAMEELLRVDVGQWEETLEEYRRYFAMFGDRLPSFMVREMDALRDRLEKAHKA